MSSNSFEHTSSLHNSLSALSRMQMLVQKKLILRQLELAYLAQKHNRSTVPSSLSEQLSEVEHQLWNHAELVLESQLSGDMNHPIIQLVQQRQHFPIAETWGAFGERLTAVQRLLKVLLELLRSEQLEVLGAVRQNIEGAILNVNRAETPAPPPQEQQGVAPVETEPWVVGITVELGHGLLSPEITGEGGEHLAEGIKSIRARVCADTGITIGLVRICDSTQLQAYEYRIVMQGFEVGRWTIRPNQRLAVGAFSQEQSEKLTMEPAYGLSALWITVDDAEEHRSEGRLVADGLTIIATHLEALLRNYLGDMLRIGQLDDLLTPIWEHHPDILDAIQSRQLGSNAVLTVFRELLKEGVSLSEPVAILRALAESDEIEADSLLSDIRSRCADRICVPYANAEGRVYAIRLSERLQAGLLSTLTTHKSLLQLTLDVEAEAQLKDAVFGALNAQIAFGEVVIICTGPLRNALARWSQRYSRWQAVLADSEITDAVELVVVADNIDIAEPHRIDTIVSEFSTAVEHSLKASAKVIKDWMDGEDN